MTRSTTILAALLAFGSACTAPRNSLNTPASSCFRSLPPAAAAVHHKGKLVGVRHVRVDRLARRVPEVTSSPERVVCVVAFEDDYRPGNVQATGPQRSGRYALVVVRNRDSKVLAVHLRDRLPLRFRHLR